MSSNQTDQSGSVPENGGGQQASGDRDGGGPDRPDKEPAGGQTKSEEDYAPSTDGADALGVRCELINHSSERPRALFSPLDPGSAPSQGASERFSYHNPNNRDLEANESARSKRATGSSRDRNITEAMGIPLERAEYPGLPNDRGQSPTRPSPPSEESNSTGERVSPWIGQDLKDATFLGAFIGGVGDFFRNYQDMKSANTIGADKYFHCMANCEATQRGDGGEMASNVIGYGREATDLLKETLLRGTSFESAVKNARDDLAANERGREAARMSLRCSKACQDIK